jgi:hypothetical protein
LKNGYVYKNVVVIDTLDNDIKIQFGDLQQSIPINEVRSVVKLSLIPHTRPIMLKEDIQPKKPLQLEQTTYYPNMKLLPVVVLGAAMAWNSLETASQVQDAIDANNQIAKLLKTQIDNSALVKARDRNTIIGYASILSAAITLAICFSDAQVEMSENRLSMRINF